MSLEAEPLARRLARQIEASGPISVAQYMRAANSEYYARADPLGVAGDFITAPEISQMFGELVGLWIADLWLRRNSPAGTHYVELGPGRGTLAADALRAAARFGFVPAVHFVETSDVLRAKQVTNVPRATFHDSIRSLPEDGPLIVVANEFFDALPVRQFVATHSGWRERVVAHGKSGAFMPMPGAMAVDTLVPQPLRHSPPGSIVESTPDSAGLVYELAAKLNAQGGALLAIDYGYDVPGLGSTLQAVSAHEAAEPFEAPGTRDLTAHVNFAELANIGRARDAAVHGPIGQGAWLEALGIAARAEKLAEASPELRDDIETARERLVSPDRMGELFRVLAIVAPDWPVPAGFD